ncbi:MAG: CBS domain-containing protein [Thermoflexales bacterium]|nr:CBS domain-containing protein [Thermoflexales bacterium]
MLVKDQMTHNPICGRPDMPVAEAAELMSQNNFRHLPIVDEETMLVGLVTQPAVTRAISASGGRLGQHEVHYILTKIKVRDIMVTEVITISPDTPIEEAARVLADKKISCLPVVQDGQPIGIITDNDLFATMVNLLGARRQGARVTVLQPDRAGEVARISKAVADKGGYLSVFVTYPTAEPATWASVLKVTNLPEETLVETLNALPDIRVQDVREIA